MSVNITRLYRAMNEIDPDGKYRWYVNADIGEVQIEAHGVEQGVAYQASSIVYGHSFRYSVTFLEIFKKMEKITKVLNETSE